MFTSAGIILAGGRSRRMGRDKAFLSLPGPGERTFVEYLTHLLTSLCHEVVLVVRDTEQMARYASYATSNIRLVADKVADTGPLMGLYTGLGAIATTHALVVAVDMPFVQPVMASFLLSCPLDEAPVVPVVKAIPQVLLAVYPRTLVPQLEALLQEGRRDLRSVLEARHVHYIDETHLREIDPQLRSFVNVNTPEELSRLRSS
ncbi:molybdenum cofactor guanylyltransferase [Ktedonosporobacter rubrisoli]|uniref:Probable molybdenum cofactor guanylyltransferase n=1 Tax=Ktedonosporobacter rubrisoli TaxID=2509675 RepID=A0A4P6K208_KTERU|nr:molybdenum cofactor guanylyltransferase [Ktedonosporobacter rubrisoli]QBD81506.1 molybdenum cofactor guanylyltransferase [Ktedonosporobacter rubrisoli]